uniref:Myelin basic protein n=1 Tax=Knipowitschia caucasica TaxID=637954 RepID=A0AAV2K360_KNICA
MVNPLCTLPSLTDIRRTKRLNAPTVRPLSSPSLKGRVLVQSPRWHQGSHLAAGIRQSKGRPLPDSHTRLRTMASGSGPSHSAFGLGRKKKSPGLMDQISKIFAGDKKKRSKGSFRGHTSPQTSSTRRKPNENAVVKFFRSLVASSPRPKSRVSFESDHCFQIVYYV